MHKRLLPEMDREFLKAYCILGLIGIIPIILFIPRYIDDYGRGIDGYFNWTKAGFRPLADAVYYILNLGSPAIAIAPLGQILCVFVAAAASLFLARRFGIKRDWLAVLATLPILVNPYFTENLSYGFDCLSMTLALALAVIAASISSSELSTKRLAIVVGILLSSLLLYQPSFGAYLPLAITLFIWNDLSKPPSSSKLRTLGGIIAAPAISLGIYKAAYSLLWQQRAAYSNDLSEPVSLLDTPKAIAAGIATYLANLKETWMHTVHFPLFIAIAGGFIWMTARKMLQTTKPSIAWTGAIAICLLLIVIAPGPLYLLPADFSAIPRMNAYISGLICSLTIPIAHSMGIRETKKYWRATATCLLVTLTWANLVFMYAYGHAMQAQREFEQGVVSRLIHDIRRIDQTGDARFIQVTGAVNRSPVVTNSAQKFPLIDRLVPRMINGPWIWGAKQLKWYGLNLKPVKGRKAREVGARDIYECQNNKISKCTSEYSVTLTGDTLRVQLK